MPFVVEMEKIEHPADVDEPTVNTFALALQLLNQMPLGQRHLCYRTIGKMTRMLDAEFGPPTLHRLDFARKDD